MTDDETELSERPPPLLLAGAAVCRPRAERAVRSGALIEAAEEEPPINVYSSTGKIVEQAEAFTKKYGVKATGTKANAAAQLEMVIREAQARNVQGDVIQISDVAAGRGAAHAAGFRRELGAAGSRRQDRRRVPEPARHLERGERLGLQHASL